MAKPPATATDYLGWRNMDRIIPIFVALPKVAKGSLKGFQALYTQASAVVDLLVTVRFFH
jgi:hypothetical protein